MWSIGIVAYQLLTGELPFNPSNEDKDLIERFHGSRRDEDEKYYDDSDVNDE